MEGGSTVLDKISPMFILPSYQGKGVAQKAITLIEDLFPQANTSELATILEGERNCYLYEKMGYNKTGVSKKLYDNATLIFYKRFVRKKHCELTGAFLQ